MVEDWVTISVADLSTVMSPAVIATFNSPDDTGATRAERVLILTVDKVLAVIASSDRIPLSLTTGPVSVTNSMPVRAVPPQAKFHTIVLTVRDIIAGQPTMDGYANSESWKLLVDRSVHWLENYAEKGTGISYPSDPDPDTLPDPTVTFYSASQEADVDMTTDGPP